MGQKQVTLHGIKPTGEVDYTISNHTTLWGQPKTNSERCTGFIVVPNKEPPQIGAVYPITRFGEQIGTAQWVDIETKGTPQWNIIQLLGQQIQK